MIRSLLSTTAILATLTLPLAAQSDKGNTFVFTPTGGTPISLNYQNSTPSSFAAGAYFSLKGIGSNGAPDAVTFDFYNVANSLATYDFPQDFSFEDQHDSVGYYIGPQIYTGSERSPTFAAATYVLLPAPEALNFGGTLVVNGGSAPISATPEPSSLALLGTGVLTLAGAARRRFLRA